jgi:subtilisin
VGTRLYKGTNLGRCADRNGHGTHVAGIIAASLNNVGVAGVAPKVRQVLSDSGSGYYSDVAEGIVEAVKACVKILSMSLGGPSDSSVLRDASYWAY